MRCPECGGPVKLAGLGTIEAEQMRDAPAPPPRPDPDPPCECGHPLIAHVTVHRGGCIGRPGGSCGPDCRNECGAQGCDCRDFVPDWSDPSPDPARGEDGEAVRAAAKLREIRHDVGLATAGLLAGTPEAVRDIIRERDEARAERDRIREEATVYRDTLDEMTAERDEARAEVERLRAALAASTPEGDPQ